MFEKIKKWYRGFRFLRQFRKYKKIIDKNLKF